MLVPASLRYARLSKLNDNNWAAGSGDKERCEQAASVRLETIAR